MVAKPDFATLWQEALDRSEGTDDAILMLMDAAALGCAENSRAPGRAVERLLASFDTLMVAKHHGLPQ